MRTINTISIIVGISASLIVGSSIFIEYSWHTHTTILFYCDLIAIFSLILVLLTREKKKNKIDILAENTIDLLNPFLECVNKMHEIKYNYKKMSFNRLIEIYKEVSSEIKNREKDHKSKT